MLSKQVVIHIKLIKYIMAKFINGKIINHYNIIQKHKIPGKQVSARRTEIWAKPNSPKSSEDPNKEKVQDHENGLEIKEVSNGGNGNTKQERPKFVPRNQQTSGNQQQQDSRRPKASGKVFKAVNLSSNQIVRDIVNRSMFQMPQLLADQINPVIKLVLKPIKLRLEHQAKVWATKIASLDYIEHYRVLGRPDSEFVQKLTNMYIYMMYHTMLTGIKINLIDSIPKSIFRPVGMCVLFDLLRFRYKVFTVDNSTITYLINVSSVTFNYILLLANEYDFISEHLVSDENTFSLYNPEIERRITKYANLIDSNDTLFLELSEFSKVSTYVNKGTFPIGNSFYDKSQGGIHYLSSSSSKPSDTTTLFGKSLFLTDDDMDSEILESYNYISSDNSVTVKYEVANVCSGFYSDVPFNYGKSVNIPENK